MENLNSQNSTYFIEALGNQFSSQSDSENEISSISVLSNLCSNNASFIDEFGILTQNKRNDLDTNKLFINTPEEVEPSKPYEEIYFINNKEDSLQQKNRNIKFTLEKADTSKNSKQFLISKKRGRQTAVNNPNEKNKITHDKFSPDNLLRKIQVHFISFIVAFINDILKNLNYSQRFFKLDYEVKKKVTKEYVESLKKKKIYEILCNKICNKYRNKDKFANHQIYEEIKNDEILNRILSEDYLTIFKNFYFKNYKTINLKAYGLDKNIILSNNTKIYKDLLKDNEVYSNYQKNLNECVNQNFMID